METEKKLSLRQRVPVSAKILLQITSFLLCLCLFGGLLAFAVTADLRQITTKDGLKTVISSLIAGYLEPLQDRKQPRSGGQTDESKLHMVPFVFGEDGNITGFRDGQGATISLPTEIFFDAPVEGSYLAAYNQVTGAPIYVVPVFGENGDIEGFYNHEGQILTYLIHFEDMLPDLSDPELDLTDPESLVDWVYSKILEIAGPDTGITKDNVRRFISQSTVPDFLADKTAGALADILGTGDPATSLEDGEIAALLQENKELLQQEFGIELTPEVSEIIQNKLNDSLQDVFTGKGLHDSISNVLQSAGDILNSEEPVFLGLTPAELLTPLVSMLTKPAMNYMMILCLVLLVLLLGANFYNIPAGLTWAGVPCLAAGGLMTLVMQLVQVPVNLAGYGDLFAQCRALFDPVHKGLMIAGLVLIAAGVLWRILRAQLEKRAVSV